MPFNKGDFTQQGVAGHVNANLRLNEKRLVNIDMTSNEEAEGCTITGTVTDLLNDKVYNIGSGVSGNIEITENGENINVAPYATATVNVSGGGENIHYCEVKIINNGIVDMGLWDILDNIVPIVDKYYDATYRPDIERGKTGSFILAGTHIYMEPVGQDPYDLYTAGLKIIGTASDTVNCSIDGDNFIVITDPTQNSSLTITITG